MRHVISPFVVLPFLLVPSAAQVSKEMAERIKKEGLENSQVMQHLDYLTNTIGHRLTGSDNFTRACEWSRAEFQKFGLVAKLEKWGEWPIVWNRGQWQGRILKPEPLELHVATPAWTGGTKGRVEAAIIKMPSTVQAIEAATKEGTLEGKWVIARRFNADRVNPRLAAALVAARVAGVLYSSRGDAKFPNRMRVFGSNRRPMRDLVMVCIRRDQFRAILKMMEGDKEVVAAFDIRNRFRQEKIVLNNVIADIRGTEKPDECVIVCGHLDSWHQATGTTDNGTGTATTMEAARILAKVGAKPKRTIRFILWGGEEQGLLGSRQYVVRHRQEMDNISCVLNHDTGTNWAHGLTVLNSQLDAMRQVFEPVMSMTPPDKNFEGDVFLLRGVARMGGGMGGSDHASFLAVGVPGLDWHLKGRSDYFRETWHSQWDTYDQAIPEYQRHTATVIALAALGVANLPDLLSREGGGRPQPKSDAQPIIEARLGIKLDGAKVTVIEDGLAKAAGFQKGDVIQSVNDKKVASAVDINAAMRDTAAPWRFVIARGAKSVGLVIEKKDAAKDGAKKVRKKL